MKEDLQLLARSSGRTARIKAGRLAALMKLYPTHPRGSRWMRDEASRLARSVAFHLRRAELLGRVITQIEYKSRQALMLDGRQDTRTTRAPHGGLRGST